MTDPVPHTGFEPKLADFFSCSDPERAPIRHSRTVIPTSPDGFAALATGNTAACRVPKFGFYMPQETDGRGHVLSRTSIWKQDAVFDKESVATTIFSSRSKGKRDRDTNDMHSLKGQSKSSKDP